MSGNFLSPAAFIFDLDGTLVDNMTYHGESWLNVAREMHITITLEEFHRHFTGKTNIETIRQLADEHITAEQAQILADRKERLYRELYRPHLRPMDGLPEFLTASQQAGVRLAVATSAPQPNIDFVLDGLQLRSYFQAVIGGDDIKNSKPDPEIFLKAARRLAIAPARCVVFEDSFAGLEAAKRAGMTAIALSTTLEAVELESLPHVERVIQDFTAVTPCLTFQPSRSEAPAPGLISSASEPE